jgi:hypothetical protein
MEEWNEPIVLTRQEFAVADALALELAPDVDRNDLGKVISYFQRVRSKDRVLTLLKRLPQSGYIRSKRTHDYLSRIAEACRRHLANIKDSRRALAVLGWSFRLMTRYQTESGQRYARGRQKRRR